MKGKIKYTDEPMGRVKVVEDFLPSPLAGSLCVQFREFEISKKQENKS